LCLRSRKLSGVFVRFRAPLSGVRGDRLHEFNFTNVGGYANIGGVDAVFGYSNKKYAKYTARRLF
jgi:hypothetical protein